MRMGLLGSLGCLLTSAGLVCGQSIWSPAPVDRPLPTRIQPLSATAPVGTSEAVSVLRPVSASAAWDTEALQVDDWAATRNTARAWFGGEYLLWWLEKGPLAAPLVTLGNIIPFGGALGQPNTAVLFGGTDLYYRPFNGCRLYSGIWLDDQQIFGLESNFLFLEKRTILFSTGSDGNGSPLIGQPFVNANTSNENAYFVSFPGLIDGHIDVATGARLWGLELHAVTHFAESTAGWQVKFLGGFRLLSLNEDLRLTSQLAPLAPGTLVTFFNGAPIDPPNGLAIFDGFNTSNQFYGLQVGSQLRWTRGLLTLEALAKFAAGYSQHLAIIEGNTTLLNNGVPVNGLPGGIFAQTTNIGRFYRNNVAIVPEIGLNVGLRLTQGLQFHLGYTLLYWSSVMRPGPLVDRVLTPSRVPSDPTFDPATGSAPRPAFPGFDFLDLWISGIRVGVEYQF